MGGAAVTLAVAWGEADGDVAAERQEDAVALDVAAGEEDDMAGFAVGGGDDDETLAVGIGRVLLLQGGWLVPQGG